MSLSTASFEVKHLKKTKLLLSDLNRSFSPGLQIRLNKGIETGFIFSISIPVSERATIPAVKPGLWETDQ